MEEKEKKNSSKWLILTVLIIGSFMATLDTSIANIAVPKIMSVFGVSLDDVKWVLTAYTLTLGAIVPLTGYLGDVFGSKRMFIFALVTFTIGSFLCGMAWSNGAMIIFRIIQAIGGGMIMPVCMTTMMQTFSKDKLGTAVGFWGIAVLAAPAVGPTLGGYILEKLDWRIIFYINVPIGILGIFMSFICLKDTPKKLFPKFDYIGFITSTISIVSILYVLGEGSSIDWGDIKNPILLTVGIFGMILFIINELSVEDPLIELRVLKNFEFTISQIVQSFIMSVLMAVMYIMPLFLQNMRNYTPIETGMILLPSALASALIMPISGKIYDKIGAKIPATIGIFILIVSSYKLACINMDTTKLYIEVIMTIRNIGIGLAVMPVTTAGMNAVVDPKLAGKASALNNTFKQISCSLGVTITTTLIQGRVDLNYSRLLDQVTPFNLSVSEATNKVQALCMQGGYSRSDASSATVATITQLVYKQAYVDAIDYALAATTVASCIAMITVIFLKNKKRKKTDIACQE